MWNVKEWGNGYILLRHHDLIDTLWNKGGGQHLSRVTHIDLIDTLWNVKEIIAVGKLLAKHDLIDTLWNVKTVTVPLLLLALLDLIDTLWNVKEFNIMSLKPAIGI